MTAKLSPELTQALVAAPNGPIEVIDPTTQRTYVLLSSETYQRIQELLGNEGDAVRDMSGLLADLAPEDWEDLSNYESPQS